MGAVWIAQSETLSRQVALKVLLGELSPEAQRRFEVEAQTAARLRHPHVVSVHEAGVDRGVPYLVMDLVDGESLKAKVERAGPLPRDEAARTLRALAQAMQYAHEQGVLHRDLKPANVLLAADGRALLTDFGVAKDLRSAERLTKTGTLVGTPGYMSPEQANAQPTDERTDVYGLGAILYTLLCAEPPFRGAPMEVVTKVLLRDPPPPSSRVAGVDRDLEAICARCMAKAPALRYPSAAELGADLQRVIAGEPALAREADLPSPARRWLGRHAAKLVALALSGAVLATAGLAVALLRAEAPEASKSPSAADRRREAVRRALLRVSAQGEAGSVRRSVRDAVRAGVPQAEVVAAVRARLDADASFWEAKLANADSRRDDRMVLQGIVPWVDLIAPARIGDALRETLEAALDARFRSDDPERGAAFEQELFYRVDPVSRESVDLYKALGMRHDTSGDEALEIARHRYGIGYRPTVDGKKEAPWLQEWPGDVLAEFRETSRLVALQAWWQTVGSREPLPEPEDQVRRLVAIEAHGLPDVHPVTFFRVVSSANLPLERLPPAEVRRCGDLIWRLFKGILASKVPDVGSELFNAAAQAAFAAGEAGDAGLEAAREDEALANLTRRVREAEEPTVSDRQALARLLGYVGERRGDTALLETSLAEWEHVPGETDQFNTSREALVRLYQAAGDAEKASGVPPPRLGRKSNQ